MIQATLNIRFQKEYFNRVAQATIPAGYIGECDFLVMGGGSRLDGQPIRIDGNTRQDVIDITIAMLRERGMAGKLRVVGAK